MFWVKFQVHKNLLIKYFIICLEYRNWIKSFLHIRFVLFISSTIVAKILENNPSVIELKDISIEIQYLSDVAF